MSYAASGNPHLRCTVDYTDAQLTEDVPTTGNAPTVAGKSGDRMLLSPARSGLIDADCRTALSEAVTLPMGAGYRCSDAILSAVESSANFTRNKSDSPADICASLESGNVAARPHMHSLPDEEACYTFVRNQTASSPSISSACSRGPKG